MLYVCKSGRIDECERRYETCQLRAGGVEELTTGESTNGEDAADAGGAAGSTAPMTRGAGNAALGVELEAEWRRKASGIVIQEITQEVKRHRDQSIGYRGHGE